MKRNRFVCGVYGLIAAALAGVITSGLSAQALPTNLPRGAAPDRVGQAATDGPSAGGTLEGVVIYRADSQRPWRYARYYVKWPQRGHLAEAVVVLLGAPLKGVGGGGEPKTAEIDQQDFRFIPETIAIRAGDRVRFRNSDVQVHNVRTTDGVRPFNVNTPMGGEYVHEFERPGGIRKPIRIGCSYHSQMRAWIFVFPHRFYQVTGEDGKFRLTGIPPGDYELQVAHPAGRLARNDLKVSIRQGETARVEVLLSPDQIVEEQP